MPVWQDKRSKWEAGEKPPPKGNEEWGWLSSVPHRLNGTELSREEFRDNLCLRYGIMPQDIPTTCNGCSKKLSIENSLYHAQRVALFLSGMMMLQRSGEILEPRPSSLVLLPTNLKSTVGQYRGRGLGLECVRKEEQPVAAQIL